MPSVRKHHKQKAAARTVVDPAVNDRSRDEPHVSLDNVQVRKMREATWCKSRPQVPGSPQDANDYTRPKHAIPFLQQRLSETAPANFKRNDDGGHSYVYKQPESPEEEAVCKEAMEGCPVEAIGSDGA